MKFKVDGAKLFDDVKKEITGIMQISEARLAHAIYNHIVDLANAELKSSKEKFLNGLHVEHDQGNTWVISLDEKVHWVELGLPAGTQMLPGILKSSKVKYTKDGSRYVNVPLMNAKAPTSNKEALALKDSVKDALKSKGISLDSVERNSSGKPKIGLVHSLNVRGPNKSENGPYQGYGPAGDIRVGHKGHPLLYGVRVYQRKGANGQISKSVMTFRVASDKQSASEYWVHPGTQPKNFFTRTEEWINQNWDAIMAGSNATSAFGNESTQFTAIDNIPEI